MERLDAGASFLEVVKVKAEKLYEELVKKSASGFVRRPLVRYVRPSDFRGPHTASETVSPERLA